jgi:hypothetical protein
MNFLIFVLVLINDVKKLQDEVDMGRLFLKSTSPFEVQPYIQVDARWKCHEICSFTRGKVFLLDFLDFEFCPWAPILFFTRLNLEKPLGEKACLLT